MNALGLRARCATLGVSSLIDRSEMKMGQAPRRASGECPRAARESAALGVSSLIARSKTKMGQASQEAPGKCPGAAHACAALGVSSLIRSVQNHLLGCSVWGGMNGVVRITTPGP